MAARGGLAMAGALLLLLVMAVDAAVDCSVELNAMQPCIEYVNSNTSAPPTKPCCAAFNATQVTMPVCLCQLQQAFSDPATAPGNVTRANEIPALCAVAVDPNRCPALLGLVPAPSPRISPIATPPAAGGGEGADVDCSAEFDSLASCITYVSSNDTAPPATCCTSLQSVHTNKPVCLCQLLQLADDPASQPVGLNVTKALGLPTSCKVTGASADNCPALLGQPVASPVEAPVAAAPAPEDASAPDVSTPEIATPNVSEPTANHAASASAKTTLFGSAIALTVHLFL